MFCITNIVLKALVAIINSCIICKKGNADPLFYPLKGPGSLLSILNYLIAKEILYFIYGLKHKEKEL